MPTSYIQLILNRIAISLTMAIYIRAGRDIYLSRKRLLHIRNQQWTNHISPANNSFEASKTTEISFVSESLDTNTEAGIFKIRVPGNASLGISPVKDPFSVSVLGPGPRRHPDIEILPPRNHLNVENLEMAPASDAQGADQNVNQTDSANWAYTKVSGLFFVALMVTWIPASANRIYAYTHLGEISPVLEFASAFVLPLQGFWNALIYATTSLPACRIFWKGIKGQKLFSRNTLQHDSRAFSPCNEGQRRLSQFEEAPSPYPFQPSRRSSSSSSSE